MSRTTLQLTAILVLVLIFSYSIVSADVRCQVNCKNDFMRDGIRYYIEQNDNIKKTEIENIKIDVDINDTEKTCIVILSVDNNTYNSEKSISIFKVSEIEKSITALFNKHIGEQLMKEVALLKNRLDIESLDKAITLLDSEKIDNERKGEKSFLLLFKHYILSEVGVKIDSDNLIEAETLYHAGNTKSQKVAKCFHGALNKEYDQNFISNNLNSTDLNTLLTIFLMHLKNKNYIKSGEIISKVNTLFPEFSWGYLFNAINNIYKKSCAEAVTIFENKLKQYNTQCSDLIRCYAYFCNDQYDIAEEYCLKSLKNYPSNNTLRGVIAEIFFLQGNFQLAIDKGYTHLDTKDQPFLQQIKYAYSLIEIEEYDKADKIISLTFPKFIENKNDLTRYSDEISYILYQLFLNFQDKESIKYKIYISKMEELVKFTEGINPIVLLRLGYIFDDIEKYEEAFIHFESIPDNLVEPNVLYNKYYWMAESCKKLNQSDKALKHFKKSYSLARVENNMQNICESSKECVDILYALNKYEDCNEWIDSFLDKYQEEINNSDEEKNKETLAYLLMKKGNCLLESNNELAASNIFEFVLDNHINYLSKNNISRAYYTLGVISFNVEKNRDKAKKYFLRADNSIDNGQTESWLECDIYYWMAVVNEPTNWSDYSTWDESIAIQVIGFLDKALDCAVDDTQKDKYSYEKADALYYSGKSFWNDDEIKFEEALYIIENRLQNHTEMNSEYRDKMQKFKAILESEL